MKAKSSPQPAKVPKMPKGNDEGGKFQDRKLVGVNPMKEQFAPTDAEPVRQRFRMGGGC